MQVSQSAGVDGHLSASWHHLAEGHGVISAGLDKSGGPVQTANGFVSAAPLHRFQRLTQSDAARPKAPPFGVGVLFLQYNDAQRSVNCCHSQRHAEETLSFVRVLGDVRAKTSRRGDGRAGPANGTLIRRATSDCSAHSICH